jgi:hypothetical protein
LYWKRVRRERSTRERRKEMKLRRKTHKEKYSPRAQVKEVR